MSETSALPETGIFAYDLEPPPGTGGPRHLCLGRPALGVLGAGGSWTCPECGSVWTVTEGEDVCGECGRSGMVLGWDYERGGRYDTAPRYEVAAGVPFTPFRDVIARRRDPDAYLRCDDPEAHECHPVPGTITLCPGRQP